MIRVLVISFECWRDDSNGGNVLSNLLEGMDDIEFAQIYCKGGVPQNKVCKKYYRMNDKMVLNAIINHESSLGNVINYEEYPDNSPADSENNRFYDFFRAHDWPIFFLLRDLLWMVAPIKNNRLRNFILEFEPNLIFAPCYSSLTMLELDRWVKSIVDVPMVSYISDDNYSLKQIRFDPFFWIHRLLIRKSIRTTSKYYSYMYTMTEQQASELSKELNIRMPILRKGVQINQCVRTCLKDHDRKYKFIYAGGTYLGRDEILYKIAKALQDLCQEGILDYEFDIYTSSIVPEKYMKVLNNNCCKIHKAIEKQELAVCYSDCDFALHVESFDRKYAYQTRLSFSTKIVDCLGSGCATIAVCPSMNAGWQYLKENNAAFCIDSIDNIKEELRAIILDKSAINLVKDNAKRCLEKNHNINLIRDNLHDDFVSLATNAIRSDDENYSN